MRRSALAVLVVCLASCGEDPLSPLRTPVTGSLTRVGSASAGDISIINLGTLPGRQSSYAIDINDLGQVVGGTNFPCCRAFLWQDGAMQDLGGPPGWTFALAINNRGQVVGNLNGYPVGNPMTWENGTSRMLCGSCSGAASDINDLGDVVGYVGGNAVIWPNGGNYQLLGAFPVAGYPVTKATAINNHGEVIGYAEGSGGGGYRPFYWSAGTGMVEIPLPTWSQGIILEAINDNSQATGYAYLPWTTHAVRWSSVVGWEDIGAIIPDYLPNAGQAIAPDGSVVGSGWSFLGSECRLFTPGANCATIWLNGNPVQLGAPAFAGTWNSGYASGINNRGQVVGWAMIPGYPGATMWTVSSLAAGSPVAETGGPYAGNEGATLTFDAGASTDPQGDVLTFTWNFGDGTPVATGVQVTHTYADNNFDWHYDVVLTARDASGTTGTVSTPVEIANVAPTVNLGPIGSVFIHRSNSFASNFSDVFPGDGPWSYVFRWGDGSTNAGTAPVMGAIAATHAYHALGSYQMILEVTDKDGGTGADTIPVQVLLDPQAPVPVVNGPYSTAEGTAITFDASVTTDPQGDPIVVSWDFGDGTPAVTGQVVTHAYRDNAAAPYQVLMTATDSGGFFATTSTTASIGNVAPSVTMTVATGWTVGAYVPVAVTFNDPGVQDGDWVVTCDWGDGRPSQIISLATQGPATCEHTYGAAGPFTVSVSVRDKDGGTGSTQQQTTGKPLNHQPTAIAGGPYSGVEGSPITVNGSQSSDPDGDPLTFSWNFRDGTVTVGSIVSHTYLDNGSYSPLLVVADVAGATHTGTATVTVANVNPVLAAHPDLNIGVNGSVGVNIGFFDAGLGDGPWSVRQDWGDGTSTTKISYAQGYSTPTPISGHVYTAAGVYQAITTVTDKDGGMGTGQFIVTVAPSPYPVPRINGPYSGKEGVTVAFSSAGTSDPNGDAITYRWTFGDGTAASTLANPGHVFRDNGTYTIQLTATDSKGLASTVSTTATIANVAPTGTFNKPSSINEGSGFQVSITTTNDVAPDKTAGFQYALNCGTGFGAFGGTASRQCPRQPDNTSVAVGGQIRDKDGGIRTFSGTVQVKNVVPKVTLTASTPTTIVRGTSFTPSGSFTDPGTLDGPWVWSISWGDGKPATTGTGTPATAIAASHVYTTAGTRTVRMTVTDKNGGKGTSNAITVTVQ